jgi:hypothetical protein
MRGREQYLLNTYGDALTAVEPDSREGVTAEKTLSALKQMDPTTSSKYLHFLVNMYIKKQFKLEDGPQLKKDLDLFDKVKSKITGNADILKFKTLDDLYNAIEPFFGKEQAVSGKQQKKLTKSEAEYIVNTPTFKVLVPKTHAAACLYGANTKWCTASADDPAVFQRYHDQGHIYIIIAGNKKFQLHFESGQFMNERDQELKPAEIKYLSAYPEYSKFLNSLISKHY